MKVLFLPETTVKLKNLTSHTRYLVSISAFNAAGDGPRSDPQQGRTHQAGRSPSPFPGLAAHGSEGSPRSRHGHSSLLRPSLRRPSAERGPWRGGGPASRLSPGPGLSLAPELAETCQPDMSRACFSLEPSGCRSRGLCAHTWASLSQ